jgi:hypothetical protein
MMENENAIVPSKLEVEIYFSQKGFEDTDAEQFFDVFSAQNWTGKQGALIKNWRAKALDWMWQKQKSSPYLRSKLKADF